ncbi:hypothetical protein G4358_13200 [Dorea formicigenerans]|uniref:COG1361 S-layer family protein n=1 Tax=Dorea formicigenerans TaxID=39486 RepID=UPI00156D7BEA|nr:hypothetical protein [Dorea formicigenerans]NSE48223.1 hypothetical protein [Dorea formicigenerans]
MTKSRRVMAVIVAALLIVAMILPGLVVKAEAAGGEKTGETDRVTTKVTIESKDNKTLQYKPGESQKWTLVISNKTGQKLSNLSVSPDMGGENADAWPFKTDYQKYEQKIDTLENGEHKEISFDFLQRDDAGTRRYAIPFSVYTGDNDELIATHKLYVNTTEKPQADNSQNQGDNGNGGGSGSGSAGGDAMTASVGNDEPAVYSGGGSGSGGSSSDGSVPRVIVTGFDTNPAEVHAGSDFTLTIHLKNTSKKTKVQNMLFELEAPTEGTDEQTSAPAFLPTSGSNSIYLDGIKADGTADISITLNAKANLLQKPYSINLSMKYEGSQATQIESSSSISIPVKQDARFEFSEFEISPQTIEVGGEANVMCSLYNLGRIKLYNAKARFEGNGIKKQEIFIGNVEAGATGSIDAMLKGEKVTNGNSKITMTLSYEDESGNISETTKDFELEVTEAVDDSDMHMNTDGDIEAGSGGFPVVPVVVVIMIIAGAVAAVVFVKKKKKKQMLNEEEELLDELDRSSEDEREQP